MNEMVKRVTIGTEKQEICSCVMVSIAVNMVDFQNCGFAMPTTMLAQAPLRKKGCLCFSPTTQTLRLRSTCQCHMMQVATLPTIFGFMVTQRNKRFAAINTKSRLSRQGSTFGTCPRAMSAICIRADSRELFAATNTIQCHARKMNTFCHRRSSVAINT